MSKFVFLGAETRIKGFYQISVYANDENKLLTSSEEQNLVFFTFLSIKHPV